MAKKKKTQSTTTSFRFADKKPEILALQRPSDIAQVEQVEPVEQEPASALPESENPSAEQVETVPDNEVAKEAPSKPVTEDDAPDGRRRDAESVRSQPQPITYSRPLPKDASSSSSSRTSEDPQESERDVYRPTRGRPKPQVIPQLESATNAAGELFKSGDKIEILAPWGGTTTAEIELIYQSAAGDVWAKYKPSEAVPDAWEEWESGVCLARLLKAAP
jgi:hypothetical protein